MSLASYQTALLRAEELELMSEERLDMPLYHIYTNKKRNEILILTNWILLRPVTSMHELFLEVHVRIVQNLDS